MSIARAKAEELKHGATKGKLLDSFLYEDSSDANSECRFETTAVILVGRRNLSQKNFLGNKRVQPTN